MQKAIRHLPYLHIPGKCAYKVQMQCNNMAAKRNFLPAILIAIVIISGCANYGGSPAPSAPPAAGANGVNIKGFAFSPGALTVKAGTTVTWTNEDSASHTIVSDSGAFSSDSIATGKTFSYTFDTAGTYEYHCGIHPSMKAKIAVEQ